MQERTSRESHGLYLNGEKDLFSGWSTVRNIALENLLRILSSRALSDGDKEDFKFRLGNNKFIVGPVLAAQLVSTENGIEFVISDSQEKQHGHITKEIHKKSPMLSGEIVGITGENFFLIDAFIVEKGTYNLPKGFRLSVNQTVNFLLDQGYVPVDAMFRIVPFLK